MVAVKRQEPTNLVKAFAEKIIERKAELCLLFTDVGSFFICQPYLEFRGQNIISIQDNPVYTNDYLPGYPGYVSRLSSY
jgi:hypothetical protein